MKHNGHAHSTGKNHCFCTALSPKVYTEQVQIEHDWNEGQHFQVYRSQKTLCKDDAFKLRMAGFTHVMVVWQHPNEGMTSMGCEIDLSFVA